VSEDRYGAAYRDGYRCGYYGAEPPLWYRELLKTRDSNDFHRFVIGQLDGATDWEDGEPNMFEEGE
jgi:hypothetical protein